MPTSNYPKLLLNAIHHYLVAVGLDTIASERGYSTVNIDSKQQLVAALLEKPYAVVALCPHLSGLITLADIGFMAQRFAEAHFLLIIDEPQRAMAFSLAPLPNVSIITMASQRNETLQALDSISKRHHYIHPAVACKALSTASDAAEANPVTLLTPTEREILILIARGLSAKEIAAERISSVNTIITHKKNIFRKLQVNTAYEATLIAMRSGLADPIEYYI